MKKREKIGRLIVFSVLILTLLVTQGKVNSLADTVGEGRSQRLEQGEIAKERQATIKAIRYEKGMDGQDKVMVVLDRMTTPDIFSPVGGKSRIVMDFVNVKYGEALPLQIDPNGLYVQHIRVGKHLDPVQKTRIVLDLVPGKKYFADQVFYEKEKIYAIIIGPQK
jgi:hypothetical protein